MFEEKNIHAAISKHNIYGIFKLLRFCYQKRNFFLFLLLMNLSSWRKFVYKYSFSLFLVNKF